jgi:hypothetical protein
MMGISELLGGYKIGGKGDAERGRGDEMGVGGRIVIGFLLVDGFSSYQSATCGRTFQALIDADACLARLPDERNSTPIHD